MLCSHINEKHSCVLYLHHLRAQDRNVTNKVIQTHDWSRVCFENERISIFIYLFAFQPCIDQLHIILSTIFTKLQEAAGGSGWGKGCLGHFAGLLSP